MKNQRLKAYARLPFIFGGASLSGKGGGYGFGEISESDSQDLLHFAYDQEIRVFDTAPIYGFGESEKRIGQFCKSKRENCFIISKGGVSWHSSKRVNMTNSPDVIEKMLHDSLRRLDSDYIDLYMIHWPDPHVDIRHPMEVLSRAKEKGIIKHLGLCNTNRDEISKATEIDSIEFIQSECNVFNQDPYLEIESILKEKEITFMSWGSLDKGILTKRVDRNRKFDSYDARSWAPWWKKMDKESKWKKVEELEKLCKKHEISLLKYALHHNLNFSYLDYVLCGPKSRTQLEQIISVLETPIHPEIYES